MRHAYVRNHTMRQPDSGTQADVRSSGFDLADHHAFLAPRTISVTSWDRMT